MMNKDGISMRWTISLVAGVASLLVACAGSEDVPDDKTESESSALMPAPGGGGGDATCGDSCSVTCPNGSCSAWAPKGHQVCCSCGATGTPTCG